MLFVLMAGKYSGLFASTMSSMYAKKIDTAQDSLRMSILHPVGILNRLAMVALALPENPFYPRPGASIGSGRWFD